MCTVCAIDEFFCEMVPNRRVLRHLPAPHPTKIARIRTFLWPRSTSQDPLDPPCTGAKCIAYFRVKERWLQSVKTCSNWLRHSNHEYHAPSVTNQYSHAAFIAFAASLAFEDPTRHRCEGELLPLSDPWFNTIFFSFFLPFFPPPVRVIKGIWRECLIRLFKAVGLYFWMVWREPIIRRHPSSGCSKPRTLVWSERFFNGYAAFRNQKNLTWFTIFRRCSSESVTMVPSRAREIKCICIFIQKQNGIRLNTEP